MDAGLRDDEGVAVDVVELNGDVPGDFEVLLLVFAHRHHLSVIEQNVGGHEHRVSKEAMVHRANVPVGKFGHLVLVAVAALQQAHGRHCAQEPGQLGVLGRVGLFPKHAAIGIEPGRQPIESHIQRVLPTLRRVGQRGHGVVVGDEVVGLALLLKADGREHGSEIIAQVQGAARLDASENAHGFQGCGSHASKGKRQNARNALNCCDAPETQLR